MKCEFEFCVYQEKGECLLDEIQIDLCGSCDSIIYVNIDKNVLLKAKYKMLENFKKRYAQWDEQQKSNNTE